MDSYGIDFGEEFSWSCPEALRERIQLVARKPSDEPLTPLVQQVSAAVNDPALTVRLNQLVTPGDRIAIAVDPSAPCIIDVLPLVLRELELAGALLGESEIVLPAGATKVAAALRERLAAEESFSKIPVTLHDPSDRSAIAYLSATLDGRPIYVARALADADVSIPIFGLKPRRSGQGSAVARFLFDGFALAEDVMPAPKDENEDEDSEVIRPISKKADRAAEESERQQDAEEAYWQLGILFNIAIAPGMGSTVAKLVVGATNQIDAGEEAATGPWFFDEQDDAALVIAVVSGKIDQQNWANAARALRLASQFASPGGIIVLLTNLAERPTSLRLSSKRTSDKKSGSRRKESSDWGKFALALRNVRKQNPIFFRSQLDQDFTEELELGFLSDPKELTRLVERQPKCILIQDAQHIRLSRADSTASAPRIEK